MKKTYLFLVLPLLLGTLTACSYNANQMPASPSQSNQNIETTVAPATEVPSVTPSNTPVEPTVTPDQPASPALTLDEVAKHNTPADCWMAINGQVYDLSPYIKLGIHPGGEKILNGCGKEATAIFMGVEKHQNKAVNYLPNYLLGKLQ